MKLIPMVERCILAAPLALSLLTAALAHAQGDAPFDQCLEESAGQADAFEACQIEHGPELQAPDALPAERMSRRHTNLQAHADGWDRIEDMLDWLEEARDRSENHRDRRGYARDRLENRWHRRS